MILRIKWIELNNFGKFENFKLDLAKDFSIIYGENEEGKSTILDAIRLLFYGSKSSSNDISKNIRKRYINDKINATIRSLFSYKGRDYLISRNFGKTNGRDKIEIIDNLTGRDFSIQDKDSPGDYFFSMNIDAFERSAFIGPAGPVITPYKAGKSDQIQDRLMNLASSATDAPLGAEIKQTILLAHRKLINGNNTGGLLLDLNKEIDELEEEHRESLTAEKERKIIRQELDKSKNSLIAYENNIAELDKEEKGLETELFNADKGVSDRSEEIVNKTDSHAGFILSPDSEEEFIDLEKKLAFIDERDMALNRERENLYAKRQEANKKLESLISEKNDLISQQEEVNNKIEIVKRDWQDQINRPESKKGGRGFLSLLLILAIGSFFFSILYALPKGLAMPTYLGFILSLAFWAAAFFLMNAQRKEEKRAREEFEKRDLTYKKELTKLEGQDKSRLIERKEVDISALQEEIRKLNSAEENNMSLFASLRKERADFSLKKKEIEDERERLARKKEEKRLIEKEKAAAYKNTILEKLNSCRQKKRELDQEKNKLIEVLAGKEGSFKEYYSRIRNAETVLSDIKILKEKRDEMEERYQALKVAEEFMDKAMEEVSRNISPKLNRRTEEIFKALTGSDDSKIRIDRDMSLSLEDKNKQKLSWQVLSSGTADQAYFALRLALTEIMEEREKTPVFLDDSFVYYDDKRARKAVDFLQDYCRTVKRQIVLFSCHGRFKDWAMDESIAFENL